MEVTSAQMKELERRADAAGLSYAAMMENAGRAAAAHIAARFPHMRQAAVFCGRGNNGGDGFVAALALHEAGVQAWILLVQGEPATECARLFLARAREAGVPVRADLSSEAVRAFLTQADIVVDGLYGTGFHGALRPEGRAAVRQMMRCGAPVAALDVPSGVAADTGEADADTVHASFTVTFHAAKPCHRLASALCGEVIEADIGIRAALAGM